MIIFGLNAYHGDAAAVALRAGRLEMAVEEERFTRVKHVAGFPRHALAACLQSLGVTLNDVDYFAVSRNPYANVGRKMRFLATHALRPSFIMNRLRNVRHVSSIGNELSALGAQDTAMRRVNWIEHHPAHLASAFFASPFDEAAVCAIDGFGDFVSTSWGIGRGANLRVNARTYFPHSLGLLYLAITQWLGFPHYGDEFKVMGLAPYGEPRYAGEMRQLIRLLPKGRYELDLRYFCHWSGDMSMTWNDGEPVIGRVFTPLLEELLGPARAAGDPLDERHEAVAASLQSVFEEAVVHVLRAVHRDTGMTDLCLAGGCAMNSVMNGKIRNETPFRRVYIQPAAGDSGTALGAALYLQHVILRQPRQLFMQHGYWGPAFDAPSVAGLLSHRAFELQQKGIAAVTVGDDEELCESASDHIAAGEIVGWFQGRMEWGARALGNRSIVADPRCPNIRDVINTKIKFREKFRPFAPSILEEALDDYFVNAVCDPFMVQVYPVRPEKRSVIPAVTHVDGTGRLQTVSRVTNPLYWQLIKAFEKRTGVPVLLNTSFNENEPIVHRPDEALDCFMRTGMDVLILGRTILTKTAGVR